MSPKGKNQSVPPSGLYPINNIPLGNDCPYNFATLAREFLDAAKYANEGFKHKPTWPTYFLLFQALENFLKAYLMAHGADVPYLKHEIGHQVERALTEAKAKGLTVPVSQTFEHDLMEMSKIYTARDFQYRGLGMWENLLFPAALIEYIEAVANTVGFHSRTVD
jgi:HEPN domain-containing protein